MKSFFAGLLGALAVMAAADTIQATQAGRIERKGAVRLEGRAFVDDHGAWNPLGATLFWALWGEKHDPERLDRNLSHLAEHGVDFVRILGMVGAPSWEDRTIDPHWPDYWAVAERLFDRLERHGLRALVTVFADAQVMMSEETERHAFVNAWARFANSRRGRVFTLEVANEAWQNGFEGQAGLAALRDLGRRLDGLTEIPVALSSLPHESAAWCAAYAGADVDVATVHYDRDVSREGGPWRAIGQPWTYPGDFDEGCEGQLPLAVINNEPIGPFSSVAADADPARIALGLAASFVAGNSAYVYHHGAGIRGGGKADLDLGRPANLYDGDPALLDALAAMKLLLPPGLASWTGMTAGSDAMPFDGFERAIEAGAAAAAYAASSASRLVLVVLDVRRPFTVVAREPVTFTLHDPSTGHERGTRRLARGEPWTVDPVPSGFVAIGARSAR